MHFDQHSHVINCNLFRNNYYKVLTAVLLFSSTKLILIMYVIELGELRRHMVSLGKYGWNDDPKFFW